MFQSRLAFLLLVTPLAACDAAAETVDAASHSSVGACVQRGVAYFESIGSYPALKEPPNQGRLAQEVARERCQASVSSF
jgi:hypothetical protein